MPTNGPHSIAKKERQEIVYQLRLDGWAQNEIAQRLGVAESTVSLDLKTAFNELKTRVEEEQVHFARTDLARMDRMLTALVPAISTGCTRSITAAIRILERRARLLGLDAALKVDITQDARDLDSIKNELVRRLAQLPQEALKAPNGTKGQVEPPKALTEALEARDGHEGD